MGKTIEIATGRKIRVVRFSDLWESSVDSTDFPTQSVNTTGSGQATLEQDRGAIRIFTAAGTTDTGDVTLISRDIKAAMEQAGCNVFEFTLSQCGLSSHANGRFEFNARVQDSTATNTDDLNDLALTGGNYTSLIHFTLTLTDSNTLNVKQKSICKDGQDPVTESVITNNTDIDITAYDEVRLRFYHGAESVGSAVEVGQSIGLITELIMLQDTPLTDGTGLYTP